MGRLAVAFALSIALTGCASTGKASREAVVYNIAGERFRSFLFTGFWVEVEFKQDGRYEAASSSGDFEEPSVRIGRWSLVEGLVSMDPACPTSLGVLTRLKPVRHQGELHLARVEDIQDSGINQSVLYHRVDE